MKVRGRGCPAISPQAIQKLPPPILPSLISLPSLTPSSTSIFEIFFFRVLPGQPPSAACLPPSSDESITSSCTLAPAVYSHTLPVRLSPTGIWPKKKVDRLSFLCDFFVFLCFFCDPANPPCAAKCTPSKLIHPPPNERCGAPHKPFCPVQFSPSEGGVMRIPAQGQVSGAFFVHLMGVGDVVLVCPRSFSTSPASPQRGHQRPDA